MYLQEDVKMIIQKMEKLFDSPVGIISKKTGISRPTVSKFFNQQTLKPSSTETIYELCLDLIEEKEKQRKRTLERKNAIFSQS
jgi:hypothetical protein|tara:strand:+ start:1116 stop:1364 length:249 start_codon:yes stop_codon:yes gene_type:complete